MTKEKKRSKADRRDEKHAERVERLQRIVDAIEAAFENGDLVDGSELNALLDQAVGMVARAERIRALYAVKAIREEGAE